MELLWIGVGMLVAAGLAFVLLRQPAPRQDPAPHDRPATQAKHEDSVPAAPRGQDAATPAAPRAVATAVPAELAAFRAVHADELPGERCKTITAVFRHIPRPPRLLDQLLSPDFVSQASSSVLADLIAAEPQISARVLATINSSLYGLPTPVASVEQAVTLLGLNTVRSICLQYLMIASFRADSPERQRVLDATWTASALASELAHQLAPRLGMQEPGALASAVVLSFLGRLATAATMPKGLLAMLPEGDLLKRLQFEQVKLGLGSPEIGRLLMADWGLPADVATDAAAIDSVLFTPCATLDPVRAGRLGLAYVCARLGEGLARGTLKSLEAVDLRYDEATEWHHLRSYLDLPQLSALPGQLRAPAVAGTMHQMLKALHESPEPA